MYALAPVFWTNSVAFRDSGVECRGALKGITVNQIYLGPNLGSAIAMQRKLSQLNAATARDARNEPVPGRVALKMAL